MVKKETLACVHAQWRRISIGLHTNQESAIHQICRKVNENDKILPNGANGTVSFWRCALDIFHHFKKKKNCPRYVNDLEASLFQPENDNYWWVDRFSFFFKWHFFRVCFICRSLTVMFFLWVPPDIRVLSVLRRTVFPFVTAVAAVKTRDEKNPSFFVSCFLTWHPHECRVSNLFTYVFVLYVSLRSPLYL